MKKYLIIPALAIVLLSATTTLQAQPNQTGVKKELDTNSEQTDKLLGRKIEQQVISGNHVEKLRVKDTTVISTPKKKVIHKKRRKHQ